MHPNRKHTAPRTKQEAPPVEANKRLTIISLFSVRPRLCPRAEQADVAPRQGGGIHPFGTSPFWSGPDRAGRRRTSRWRDGADARSVHDRLCCCCCCWPQWVHWTSSTMEHRPTRSRRCGWTLRQAGRHICMPLSQTQQGLGCGHLMELRWHTAPVAATLRAPGAWHGLRLANARQILHSCPHPVSDHAILAEATMAPHQETSGLQR